MRFTPGLFLIIIIMIFFLQCSFSKTNKSNEPVLIKKFDLGDFGSVPGMRLGDVNADNRMEIVIGQINPEPADDSPRVVCCVTVFDLNGNKLLQVGSPGNTKTAHSDIPIQVYDIDGDGKSEILAAMDHNSISVINGITGEIKKNIPLPLTGAHDCIIIANVRGGSYPKDIIIKDRYSQLWVIDNEGSLLWSHAGNIGHFPLVFDWDNDGKDEVMAGYDFLDHDGALLYSIDGIEGHADCIATGDIDGDPGNGYEIVVGGNITTLVSNTGSVLWRDNHSVEVQQMGIGNFRQEFAGLEVVLLDRIGPRTDQGKDANVLLSSDGTFLWKEERSDYGWLTVTETISNWDDSNSDYILSYRRGGNTPPSLYDGYGNIVAAFKHDGSFIDFVQHADLCGNKNEEVIVYNESTVWIFARDNNGLEIQSNMPIQQQFHLYNWSIYSGWIYPDKKISLDDK